MTTLGFRGLLAGFIALSLGAVAGASQGAQAWTPGDPAPAGPGLMDHAKYRACLVSQGLSARTERQSALERRRECGLKHGIDA